ncbi:MAG: hypothetical protein CMH94_08110 [Oceanicaulis sp.]|nr:hypothetical protein [Oceanicaulis sp.]MAZ91511.1 hypothetical protein [Maricaulis sp.]MBI75550.1 hypothetical protein [Oceanicaulis sp.]
MLASGPCHCGTWSSSRQSVLAAPQIQAADRTSRTARTQFSDLSSILANRFRRLRMCARRPRKASIREASAIIRKRTPRMAGTADANVAGMSAPARMASFSSPGRRKKGSAIR